MNIAVINIKDIIKLAVKFGLLILLFIISFATLKNIKINVGEKTYVKALDKYIVASTYFNNIESKKESMNNSNVLDIGLGSLNNYKSVQSKKNEDKVEEIIENNIEQVVADLPEDVITQKVEEHNIVAKVTNSYNGVEVNNQSDYELTEDILVPDFEIQNKNDIYIYHTHTCESYTPSENFIYEASGNYRTIDLNYSVARVGTELSNYLEKKGFSVKHNTTYHDYPSYSGSYDRSLQTIQSELGDSNTEIVIDLHRDAVGDGASYGPTVKINDQYAAQIMFVIGTDGGGLEHPNWKNNLKFAIKIQEVANQMYPGLFRPIILRNSRYNQHIRSGACIIEVGATGNTMEQCILSMQCLSNVFEKALK